MLQLYVGKRKTPVRFGLMHVLATNLVVWIRALVFEVVAGVHHANEDSHAAMEASSEERINDASSKCSSRLSVLSHMIYCINK